MLEVNLTEKELSRIWSKIKIDNETGCWNWIGETINSGYGRFRYKRRKESIHRIMYANKYGPIPRGRAKNIPVIDHICNNKSCCNPDHLKLVSHKENVLRSPGPTTTNHNKTHCVRGHLLPTEPNDLKKTKRYCKICASLYHTSHKK